MTADPTHAEMFHVACDYETCELLRENRALREVVASVEWLVDMVEAEKFEDAWHQVRDVVKPRLQNLKSTRGTIMGSGARDTSVKVMRPDPQWLVECCDDFNRCTLVSVPQASPICPKCKKSIFDDEKTGRDHRA